MPTDWVTGKKAQVLDCTDRLLELSFASRGVDSSQGHASFRSKIIQDVNAVVSLTSQLEPYFVNPRQIFSLHAQASKIVMRNPAEPLPIRMFCLNTNRIIVDPNFKPPPRRWFHISNSVSTLFKPDRRWFLAVNLTNELESFQVVRQQGNPVIAESVGKETVPEVTAHTPGTPSRAELSTTDEAGALAFYGSLFGWVDDPQQIGENRY